MPKGMIIGRDEIEMRLVMKIKKTMVFVLSMVFALMSLFACAPKKSEEEISEEISLEPELLIQSHHGSNTFAIAFSPDGRFLATDGMYNTIKVWNTETGKLLKNIIKDTGHDMRIVSLLSFSFDGQFLIGQRGFDRGYFFIIDVDSGKVLWDSSEFDYDASRSRSIRSQLCPSKNIIAYSDSGNPSNTITIAELETGNILCEMKEMIAPVYRVVFSNDGRLLTVVDEDGRLYIWETENFTLEKEILDYEIENIAFSDDSSKFVAICKSGRFITFTLKSYDILHDVTNEKVYVEHSRYINKFTKDLSRVVVRFEEDKSKLGVLDLHTGELLNITDFEDYFKYSFGDRYIVVNNRIFLWIRMRSPIKVISIETGEIEEELDTG